MGFNDWSEAWNCRRICLSQEWLQAFVYISGRIQGLPPRYSWHTSDLTVATILHDRIPLAARFARIFDSADPAQRFRCSERRRERPHEIAANCFGCPTATSLVSGSMPQALPLQLRTPRHTTLSKATEMTATVSHLREAKGHQATISCWSDVPASSAVFASRRQLANGRQALRTKCSCGPT
jgi:hypothetical protein